MEETTQASVETGVNETPAAEVQTQETQVTQTSAHQTESGVETKAAAEPENGAEKAFAARLAKERQKIEQQAKDAIIAEMGYEWQGRLISTEAEYRAALKEQELINQYKDLHPEVAQKLAKVDQLEQRLTGYEHKELLQKQEVTLADKPFFKEWVPQLRQMADQFGTDLQTAYDLMASENLPKVIADYEVKIAALEAKFKAQEVNDKNAASSPGSVTGNGSAKDDFISLESFEANKNDQRWVMNNYSKIMSSRTKW